MVSEGRASGIHMSHSHKMGPPVSTRPGFFRVLVSYLEQPWVHSSVARAADCRSAGPWLKSGCALLSTGAIQPPSDQPPCKPAVPSRPTWRANPVTRNRTRDHLMAALIYSQMLYQLSYDRLVLPRPQPMSTSASSMHPSDLLPDASARYVKVDLFARRVLCTIASPRPTAAALVEDMLGHVAPDEQNQDNRSLGGSNSRP